MTKTVTSPHNHHIKQLLQLQQKSRIRRKEGLFVIEGLREIGLAAAGGIRFQTLFICPELLPERRRKSLPAGIPEIIEIPQAIYQKAAYRGSTEGVMVIARNRQRGLDELSFKTKNPLLLVAEAPEKPGNIGALLRTADAANLDAVLIANPRTDLYNPNIIRSSVGGVFTNQVVAAPSSKIIQFLKKENINIYCAALQASQNYTHPNYSKPTAIVVGTEADGLREEWLENSTQNIIIPMQGQIDSMNVSVSAGILLFEACRQRGFP